MPFEAMLRVLKTTNCSGDFEEMVEDAEKIFNQSSRPLLASSDQDSVRIFYPIEAGGAVCAIGKRRTYSLNMSHAEISSLPPTKERLNGDSVLLEACL